MNIEQLKVERGTARKLYREYVQHRDRMTPADREIAAVYRRIAQGQTVIRALHAIAQAGLGERGMPRLAIARADEREIECSVYGGAPGTARFEPPGYCRTRTRKFEVRGFEHITEHRRARATVPLIPVHLRPKFSLSNYHILWEAEWGRVYPADPYLLRRFGGDAWLVVAAWELTDVERAVMQSRLLQ